MRGMEPSWFNQFEWWMVIELYLWVPLSHSQRRKIIIITFTNHYTINLLSIESRNLIFIHIFLKYIKCLDNEKCRCIFITRFENLYSMRVNLVPNLTHFDAIFRKVTKHFVFCVLFILKRFFKVPSHVKCENRPAQNKLCC